MKYLWIDLFPSTIYDKHAIYSITAVLKKIGHEVDYCCTNQMSRAKRLDYDIRLYSMFEPHIDKYNKFEEELHDNRSSLAGGFGATFGKLIMTKCTGEGEAYFMGEPNSLVEDLNSLPYPDRSIIYNNNYILRKFPSKQFLSGRGCPYQCSYCFNHAYRKLFPNSTYIRRKSVDYMIGEIMNVQADYSFRTVVFQDDTFILDANWLEEWAVKWNARKPYTCNIRANLMTDDICSMLIKSNCVGVNWSIESGSERIRNGILRRNMSNDQIYRCAELLHKYNIPFRVASMIGLPTETHLEREETLSMASKLKANYAFCNTFIPYPGLDITKYAIEKGCYNIQDIPDNFYKPSCLNFTSAEKEDIQRKCLTWSGIVRDKKYLEDMPMFMCKMYWKIMDKYNMAKLYLI